MKSRFEAWVIGWGVLLIITEIICLRIEAVSREGDEKQPSQFYIYNRSMEKMVLSSLLFREGRVHNVYHKLSVAAANIHSALFIFITSCIT